jgi:hypothetical protein
MRKARRGGRAADCTGLENQCAGETQADASTNLSISSNANPKNSAAVLASCLALLARKSPDLALVVERWDTLPEALRAGILAMIDAASACHSYSPKST